MMYLYLGVVHRRSRIPSARFMVSRRCRVGLGRSSNPRVTAFQPEPAWVWALNCRLLRNCILQEFQASLAQRNSQVTVVRSDWSDVR